MWAAMRGHPPRIPSKPLQGVKDAEANLPLHGQQQVIECPDPKLGFLKYINAHCFALA